MEYTELSRLWKANESTSVKISLNQKAINEVTVNELKSSLKEIKWSSILEIVANFIWLTFLGDFAIKNYQENYFLLAAIILFGNSILSIVLETKKLYLFSSLDNNFSVIKAQKRIEKLKFLEELDTNLLYFIIPMFFVPFVLVITKGLLNIDLFQLGFGGYEIALATLGSAIIAMFVVFVLRKSQFKTMNESLKFLKEISQNE